MATLNKLIGTCKAAEISAVSGRIILEYEKADLSADTYLLPLFESLKTVSEKLTAAINRITTKSVLEEKDKIRDDKVKAINHLVLGFLHHPDKTISSAAEKVNNIFKHYGVDITRKSYTTESSLVNSLLQDFSKAEIKAAITHLPGLSAIVDELETAEKVFTDEVLLYREKKAKEKTNDTATEIKKEVKSIINNKLIVYLRAMVQANEETYGSFADTIARIINDNNQIVKKRRRAGDKTG